MTAPYPHGVSRPAPIARLVTLTVCVLAIGASVAWLYYSMRAVMDVGGTCAEGGPYVIETHCPEGSVLFTTVSVPLWFAGVFIGMFAGATLRAPTPILPAWFLLFGALGWNFLDYAFAGDGPVEAGWLICGIAFELMALPALGIWIMARTARGKITDGPSSGLQWTLFYVAAIAIGLWLGHISYFAWTS